MAVDLFNHLSRPLQERRRDRQGEGLGGLEVDEQFEFAGLFDGKVARLCALEDLADERRTVSSSR